MFNPVDDDAAVDTAVGVRISAVGLRTLRGFLGQGSGVCGGGLALDVWDAMASVADGALLFGGALDVWDAMASAADGALLFGGALDVWDAMASAAVGVLPFGGDFAV